MPDKIPAITEKIDGRPCWERLSGEREKSFAAFQFYRDLGSSRTIPDVVRFVKANLDMKFATKERMEALDESTDMRHVRQSLGRGVGGKRKDSVIQKQLYDWAQAYAWNQRCDFYDRHLDQLRVLAAEENVKEMVKRHLTISTAAQKIAETKFAALNTGENAKDISPEVALRYAVEGTKMERLTRGESTESTRVVTGDAPVLTEPHGAARDEIMSRINKIREKTKELAESSVPQSQPGQKPDLKIVRKEA